MKGWSKSNSDVTVSWKIPRDNDEYHYPGTQGIFRVFGEKKIYDIFMFVSRIVLNSNGAVLWNSV
jgi:hypothetical protein